jgi:hypothetical protein
LACVSQESVGRYRGGSLKHRARTTTAGFLLTAGANILLVIVLGLRPDRTDVPKTDPVHASAV